MSLQRSEATAFLLTLTRDIELYTPPKPIIFCGRDGLVKDIVNTLLLPGQIHIALIGPGGIGKTTISKAILNEEHVATMFNARLFITYDNVDYAQMNYETFLSRIAEVLQITTSSRMAVLNRLKLLKRALLVIDNAETFIEAGRDGFRDISQTLDEMGTLCRIIFTTRNTDTVPTNLRWHTIKVQELDIDAAVDNFTSIYKRESIDEATKNILLELECHPLSINILANSATFNEWSLEQLVVNWKTQQKSSILEIRKDRYHSVGFAIDLSISCSDFNETREQVMKLLRAVAFLPQGIHRRDLEGILRDDSAVSIAESLCRCSLTYWRDDRLVVLSPIRMYITEKYNTALVYGDDLVDSIREHYYPQIAWKVGHCAKEEHANLDRVFLFDMSQDFVQVETLQYLWHFASELYTHNAQPMSLWPSLTCAQSEVELHAFNDAKANAMIWMSALYGRLDHNRTCLEMIEAAEQFCRHTDGLEGRLAECLSDKGDRLRYLGRINEAETCLREAHAIFEDLEDDEKEALVDSKLSHCAFRKGDLSEATALLNLAKSFLDQRSQAWTNILLNRAHIALLQGDFDEERNEIARAMRNDEAHHGGRRRLEILNRKADLEARAGATQAADTLLADITATEILPGRPDFQQFLVSVRGQAYCAGIVGDIESSRMHAARALLLASEGRSDDSYRRSLLMSGYVEMFAHEYSKARGFLQSALIARDAEILLTTALVYRALGEVAALQEATGVAERFFSQIDSLCDEMGIPASCFYINERHWYTLPDDRFPAWSLYLTRHQSQT